MNKIIAVSVSRFSTPESQDVTYFEISDDTPLDTIQDALLMEFEKRKDSIVNACRAVYQDDEKDGFEKDRAETYDNLVENIKNIQAIEKINRFWMLDDGVDEDTEESINSGISIGISPVTKL